MPTMLAHWQPIRCSERAYLVELFAVHAAEDEYVDLVGVVRGVDRQLWDGLFSADLSARGDEWRVPSAKSNREPEVDEIVSNGVVYS